MGAPKTHDAAVVFVEYTKHLRRGFTKSEAAKKAGVSRDYPRLNFTALQIAEIDQIAAARMFNKGCPTRYNRKK